VPVGSPFNQTRLTSSTAPNSAPNRRRASARTSPTVPASMQRRPVPAASRAEANSLSTATDSPYPASQMRVEVVRSHRRRKTVEAQEFGDTLRISIPASMSKTEEEHWVRVMVGRAQRWRAADRIDLEARARSLSARYGLPAPTSVVWAHNQKWRWGSCSPSDGSLRISSHLATMPTWVLDYVLVHEMAHLVVPEHGPEFWRLVNRYPRTERARGYLMAKSGE